MVRVEGVYMYIYMLRAIWEYVQPRSVQSQDRVTQFQNPGNVYRSRDYTLKINTQMLSVIRCTPLRTKMINYEYI